MVGDLNTAHIDSAHLCMAQGRSLGVLRGDYDRRIMIHAWCAYDGRGLNPRAERSESIEIVSHHTLLQVYLPPAKVRFSVTYSTAAWRGNVSHTRDTFDVDVMDSHGKGGMYDSNFRTLESITQ